MSSDSPQTDPEETSLDEASAFADQLQAMLEKLVPPDGVVITDINGTEYALPTALPARRQVVAFREMKKLLDLDVIRESSAEVGSVADVVNLLVDAAASEEVSEALSSVFNAAYPGMVDGDPLDLFPIEELVISMLPFSGRFAARLGGRVAEMLSKPKS